MKSIYLSLLLFCIFPLGSQEYQHLIIYGQSLSTGHQSWPPLSTVNVEGNFMIGSQIWINFGNTGNDKLNPLISNVLALNVNLPKSRASMTCAENALVSATNYIQLKTEAKFKFIASSCGAGGKTIEELSKEHYITSTYGNFIKALDCAKAITSSLECPSIFWMQGEYNYTKPVGSTGLTQGSAPTSDKATYKSLLLQLKNNMQNDILSKYKQISKPLFITYQTGAQYSRGKELTIGMAQLEASNEFDDIVCAGPIYPVTDRGGHLEPNGYRWYGEMLGKAYYRTKISGQRFQPLQPVEFSKTANPKILRIRFYVPKLPLVLDEMTVKKVKDYGFEVYDNNVKKTIQSIVIDGNSLFITFTSNIEGTLEVVYAGTNVSGHGNLRDSDDETACFKYVDLDRKNVDGTYLFERDTAETTLRPSFEPRDENGQIIYDKPYPLYNFSLAFYYKIDKDSSSYRVPNVKDIYTSKIEFQDNSGIIMFHSGTKIVVDNLSSEIIKVDIFSISGQLITSFYDQNNNNRREFDVGLLSKGIYLITLTSESGNKLHKESTLSKIITIS